MIRKLSVAAVALAISMPATAQAPAQKYRFCYGAAGNPRLENFTRVFATSRQDPMTAEFMNAMNQKYAGYYTQENECPMRATAAEADAERRKLMDDMNRASPGSTVQIDWLPKGATALSGPVEKTTAPAAAPKPQTSAAGAPAASAGVQLDMWGKPIPTTAYWTCVTHMTKVAYAAKPFFGGANGKASNEIFAAFNDYLIKTYHEAGTASCNQFTTLAEAQKSLAQQEAAAPSTGYKWVGIGWAYASSAPPPTAAAPVPAPKPPAPAPAVPAAAATPPAPAPTKPAPAATSKPAGYVFCRSEFNTSMKRFYNPPVDGRGATYAEWQPAYKTYLEKTDGPVTNISCGKYPTKEAAQKDYDEAVANARAQPTINGLQSPVVITNWAY